MKRRNSKAGFSLMEVVIGVALVALAATGISQVSLQLAEISRRSAAESRITTTVANIATDARALLRYDGPAAQALQVGTLPSSFTAYQWEPDLAQAPVICSVQHLAAPQNVLRIRCVDRHGTSSTRNVDLSGSQPLPAATVTASPS